jgi:uncharacterized protein (DUF433 family)
MRLGDFRRTAKGNPMETLERITRRPGVMGGKACIRGMRVTVGMIVNQIGAGRSVNEVLADFPYIEHEDVMQALRYAAWLAEERELALDGA